MELTLSERQIPAFADAIGAMAVSKASRFHSLRPVRACRVELPALTKEVKIEGIDLTADVAPENSLEQQTVKIRMTGTDDSGKRHDLALRIRVRFGIDEIAGTIDLTGRKRGKEADRIGGNTDNSRIACDPVTAKVRENEEIGAACLARGLFLLGSLL